MLFSADTQLVKELVGKEGAMVKQIIMLLLALAVTVIALKL